MGGGLGLALMPDFRVASPEARFSANFARLGFHQGFGLSVTLPRLVGQQVAQEMLYTGRRVPGDEAHRLGLCDRLVPLDEVRKEATALAREIALSAPLAVDSIRETLRGDLAEAIRIATDRELKEHCNPACVVVGSRTNRIVVCSDDDQRQIGIFSEQVYDDVRHLVLIV